jgi:nucleoid DNA-binding protein
MTFDQLVRTIAAQEPSRTAIEVRKTLLAAFTLIAESTIHGRPVKIHSFGVFYQRTRKGRRIRNIKTKDLIELPPQVCVGFRCSSSIKR